MSTLGRKYSAITAEFMNRIAAFHAKANWVLGGDSPMTGFDCSGLVNYFLSTHGYRFPYGHPRPTAAVLFDSVFTRDEPDPRVQDGELACAIFEYKTATPRKRISASSQAKDGLVDHVILRTGTSHATQATALVTQRGLSSGFTYGDVLRYLTSPGYLVDDQSLVAHEGTYSAPRMNILEFLRNWSVAAAFTDLEATIVPASYVPHSTVNAAQRATNFGSNSERNVFISDAAPQYPVDDEHPTGGVITRLLDWDDRFLDHVYVPLELVYWAARGLCPDSSPGESGGLLPVKVPVSFPDDFVNAMKNGMIQTHPDIDPSLSISGLLETADGEDFLVSREPILMAAAPNHQHVRTTNILLGPVTMNVVNADMVALINLRALVQMFAVHFMIEDGVRVEGEAELSDGVMISGYDEARTHFNNNQHYYDEVNRRLVDETGSSHSHVRYLSKETIDFIVGSDLSPDQSSDTKYVPVKLV